MICRGVGVRSFDLFSAILRRCRLPCQRAATGGLQVGKSRRCLRGEKSTVDGVSSWAARQDLQAPSPWAASSAAGRRHGGHDVHTVPGGDVVEVDGLRVSLWCYAMAAVMPSRSVSIHARRHSTTHTYHKRGPLVKSGSQRIKTLDVLYSFRQPVKPVFAGGFAIGALQNVAINVAKCRYKRCKMSRVVTA